MERSAISPDAFLASVQEGVRENMTALDRELARVFAGHERVLWEGPMWGGTHQQIISADRLGKVKVGSANVTFRRLADVDLETVVELAARARDLVFPPR